MNSRIYECQVMHARFAPKAHRFAYRIFMLAVDLDELATLDQRLKLFSVNRRNLYAFRERDYLPTGEKLHNASAVSATVSKSHDSGTARLDESAPKVAEARMRFRPKPATENQQHAEHPSAAATAAAAESSTAGALKNRVLAYLRERGVGLGPQGRVELVTLPRVFGYLFNPVSFYFCYDSNGDCVASLAEVTNTFREMKPYFLGPDTVRKSEPKRNESDDTPTASLPAAPLFHLRTPKDFYVSPFSDVDVAFDFRLRPPTEKLSIQIDDYVGAQRTLTSTLTGPARPLTDARLAWFTLKYPLITLKIIGLIHWHALLLYFKKVPWFGKAARAADQRNLYRPHGSVAHNVTAHDA